VAVTNTALQALLFSPRQAAVFLKEILRMTVEEFRQVANEHFQRIQPHLNDTWQAVWEAMPQKETLVSLLSTTLHGVAITAGFALTYAVIANLRGWRKKPSPISDIQNFNTDEMEAADRPFETQYVTVEVPTGNPQEPCLHVIAVPSFGYIYPVFDKKRSTIVYLHSETPDAFLALRGFIAKDDGKVRRLTFFGAHKLNADGMVNGKPRLSHTAIIRFFNRFHANKVLPDIDHSNFEMTKISDTVTEYASDSLKARVVRGDDGYAATFYLDRRFSKTGKPDWVERETVKLGDIDFTAMETRIHITFQQMYHQEWRKRAGLEEKSLTDLADIVLHETWGVAERVGKAVGATLRGRARDLLEMAKILKSPDDIGQWLISRNYRMVARIFGLRQTPDADTAPYQDKLHVQSAYGKMNLTVREDAFDYFQKMAPISIAEDERFLRNGILAYDPLLAHLTNSRDKPSLCMMDEEGGATRLGGVRRLETRDGTYFTYNPARNTWLDPIWAAKRGDGVPYDRLAQQDCELVPLFEKAPGTALFLSRCDKTVFRINRADMAAKLAGRHQGPLPGIVVTRPVVRQVPSASVVAAVS
jgi:hypothetical protein